MEKVNALVHPPQYLSALFNAGRTEIANLDRFEQALCHLNNRKEGATMQRLLDFVIDNKQIIQLVGAVIALIGVIVGVCMVVSFRRSGRGLSRAVNETARRAADVTLDLANASVGALGGFANAIETMVKTTQSLTDIITAMAICWDRVLDLMEDRRYYDAAKRIATDPRIKTIVTTRRLVSTIYLIALHDSTGKTKGDSRRIEEEFPFVIEALEPFPDFALPLPPEEAPKKDAASHS
jgi:hypothetical protein